LFGFGRAVSGWAFAVPFASLAGLIGISLRKIERHYGTGHLTLVRGSATRKDIDINAIVTIGSADANTIGLSGDGNIEQQHAEVIRERDGYTIEDKGSRTGTFVNRKMVNGRQTLKDGDVIEMGGNTLVFSNDRSRTCSGCGESLRTEAKFCPKCGGKK
jgi:pSer/pThr/pTyr-binding forkhead associated (FHA) protein